MWGKSCGSWCVFVGLFGVRGLAVFCTVTHSFARMCGLWLVALIYLSGVCCGIDRSCC